jgi:dye decolorizing peroxidase
MGGAVGAAAAVALPAVQAQGAEAGSIDPASAPVFHGAHQAGIATPAQGHLTLVAFTLLPRTDRAALGRLFRTWTQSIDALMAGRPAPGDAAPELAGPGSRLTVTVGVGAEAVALNPRAEAVDLTIPAFTIDRLEPRWTGGDLVLQVCADDSTTVHHAVRMLTRDAAPFARPAWSQSGFNGQRPSGPPRNLMGLIEGTGNPPASGEVFNDAVWTTQGPAWLTGGTVMAVRRIRMGLDAWDTVPEDERDKAIGRRVQDGAPRGRKSIADSADFDLLDTLPSATHVHGDGSQHLHRSAPVGLAIPDDAHIRRAHPAFNDGRRNFRRAYSYSDAIDDAGLVFIAFQADLDAFIGIQRSLAKADALNAWTTPVGSAAFAILPGCEPGDWLGRTLIEA